MAELRDAEPIVFNFGAAEGLIAQFRATADGLRSQISRRNGLAGHARAEWRGAYAGKFDARMRVCSRDAERLAAAMEAAAAQVQELSRLAREEQDRRAMARDWKQRHDKWQHYQDHRGLFDQGVDFVFGNDEPKPPNLTPTRPPTIPIAAPTPQGRG
jgi:uncharacterized protein YukE